MRILVAIMALFLTSFETYAACRAIAQRDGTGQLQTFADLGINIQESDQLRQRVNEVYGPDLVYQGGNCPAGKICVETLYTAYTNRGVNGIHGQVVVLNPETGAVDGLLPIRFRDQNEDAGQPLGVRGIPPRDPARWNRVCSAIDGNSMSSVLDANLTEERRRQNQEYEAERPSIAIERQRLAEFCRGNDNGERRQHDRAGGGFFTTSVGGADLLDLNFYGASVEPVRESDSRAAPGEEPRGNPLGANFYKNFTGGTKLNVIQDLNRPASARVAPSRLQSQGGGTVTLLRQRVDAVRKALNCPITAEVATTASLADYTRGPASNATSLPFESVLSQLRERNVRRAIEDCHVDIRDNGDIRFREYSGYTRLDRVDIPINAQSCNRTYGGDGVETITCSRQTSTGRSVPFINTPARSANVTFQVRNGRLISLQRSNPKTEPGHQGSCTIPASVTSPGGQNRRGSGSNQ